MPLDQANFLDQFQVFQDRLKHKSKAPFVSFREGAAAFWEGHKLRIRERALKRLDAGAWEPGAIGSGRILKRVIAAIELPKDGEDEANNLVNWQPRKAQNDLSHESLRDALDQPSERHTIERLAFDLYRAHADEGEAFEGLRAVLGSRYDLLAYLFFLRDSDRFMPIGATTFDKAFQALGIPLKTAWKCSWENYRQYNAALQEVRAALTTYADLPDIRLVDAHSFCWLLVRPELERDDVLVVQSAKGKASNAKIYGGRDVAIANMVETTVQTVAQSNGQKVEVIKKVKNLFLSTDALRAHIDELMRLQDERCALTGIPLDYRKEGFDRKRRPSLDRIDSDGHYEAGNLQVVCSFINQWKSATPDAEFRRLLELVRHPDAIG